MVKAAEATDLFATVSSTFQGFETALMGVVGIGLGIALVKWGIPQGVSFIKKLAR